MQVQLSENITTLIDQHLSASGCATADAFLTALVERFQEEQTHLREERTAINAMLERAVNENDYTPFTQDDIDALKRVLD